MPDAFVKEVKIQRLQSDNKRLELQMKDVQHLADQRKIQYKNSLEWRDGIIKE